LVEDITKKAYNIDQGTFQSNFLTVIGGISATSGKKMEVTDYTTYVTSATFKIYFTLNNYIPAGGFIVLTIPADIEFIKSPFTKFKAWSYSGGNPTKANFIGSGKWSPNSMTIQVPVKANKGDYAIDFGGARNPRSFEATQVFEMRSTDAQNNPVGEGSLDNIRMNKEGYFDELKVEPSVVVNGALSDYTVTFKSSIPIQDGDIFYLSLPSSIRTPKEPQCLIKKCITAVTCNSEKGRIVANFDTTKELSDCKTSSSEISFVILSITNAPTMIESGPLAANW